MFQGRKNEITENCGEEGNGNGGTRRRDTTMETGKMQKFRGLAGWGKHRGIDLGRQIIFTARIKFRKKKASSYFRLIAC